MFFTAAVRISSQKITLEGGNYAKDAHANDLRFGAGAVMSPRPNTARRPSPANRLRGQIEKAEADGQDRVEMTLRLTHADVSQLKRDPDLPLADISFADGVMRYLGVRVEEGGVSVSELVTSS